MTNKRLNKMKKDLATKVKEMNGKISQEHMKYLKAETANKMNKKQVNK